MANSPSRTTRSLLLWRAKRPSGAGSRFASLRRASRESCSGAASAENSPEKSARVVAIGADHGGFELKQQLKDHLRDWGYQVLDLGTDSADAVDYPDFAEAVGNAVARGEAWLGIVLDSAGIGSSIAANKVPGVRAALCYDRATARNSREHNDANVLTLGAKLIAAGSRAGDCRVVALDSFRGRAPPAPRGQDSQHRGAVA